MATGWTFEEIGQLTLRDLSDLRRYWTAHPPLHMMVRAYFGIKESSPPSPYLPKVGDEEGFSIGPTDHHNPTVEELQGIIGQFPEFR